MRCAIGSLFFEREDTTDKTGRVTTHVRRDLSHGNLRKRATHKPHIAKTCPEDKKLIFDAMRNRPYHAAVYYQRKILREPRYDPLWDVFERKKKWEVPESTA